MTVGQTNDCKPALELLIAFESGTVLFADKAYNTTVIRDIADQRQAWANIPPRKTRKGRFIVNKWIYRQRNLIERFTYSLGLVAFIGSANKIKNYRGIATR